MPQVGFREHPSAALEYWFFKVNAGPIALIVDWIERRRRGDHVLRVSVHSPYKREVLFDELPSWMPGENFMTTERCAGHAGEVSWDLTIDVVGEPVMPDIFPAGLLKVPDLATYGWPLATFTGWIRHGPEHVALTAVPGSITQYWGRRLATEWWWVSAHQFDRGDTALEGTVLRSRVWGTPVRVPLAYFFVSQEGKAEFIVTPPGSVRVEGTPEEFRVDIRRRHREVLTLLCAGREYGDFGDGIVNTLVGDMEVREGDRVLARATGTAGLERRSPNAEQH
ncbi:hypothetical protein [Microbacterium pumilum]|uniref:AttH domain-containing protein n=1 Tax=Microbacterium pumilum TaxID=344165 RepID=A0ABP5EKR8_9MICO